VTKIVCAVPYANLMNLALLYRFCSERLPGPAELEIIIPLLTIGPVAAGSETSCPYVLSALATFLSTS